MKGAMPQVRADAGTHQAAKAKGKGARLSKGLFPASKALVKLVSGKGRGAALTGTRLSFADALKSKTEEKGGTLEKLRACVEAAIKGLKKEGFAASAFEKAFRRIMDDPKLDARQKAAGLKKLLAQIREKPSMAAEAQGLAAKTAVTAPAKQESQAKDKEAVEPAEAPRRAAGPRLYVLDLRKKPQESGKRADLSGAGGTEHRAGLEKSGPDGFLPSLKAAAEREPPQREVQAPSAPRTGADMTPVERLREMAGSELARAAGIILKDGGGGEIRLLLKPESLGSVRVRLNLSDNVIDGKIFVDNPDVKHVLEGSLDSMTRALQADGFQTASLQVSVSGDGGGTERRDREPLAVARIETENGFADAVPNADGLAGLEDNLVDLFA